MAFITARPNGLPNQNGNKSDQSATI